MSESDTVKTKDGLEVPRGPDRVDVYSMDVMTGERGALLAQIRREGDKITVEGDSPMAESLRERAGKPMNETPQRMVSGMSRYWIEDLDFIDEAAPQP